MRIALVANPTSGGVPIPRRSRARCAGTARRSTCSSREPRRPRATVADDAPDRLAIASGDGTIGPWPRWPGGSTSRSRVIPAAPRTTSRAPPSCRRAADAAVELAVTGTELRRFELGRLADGRPFVNVASAGLATVAARRAAPLKPRLGPLAYAVGAARAAVGASPLPCAVRADGEQVFAGEAWQVILAVTGAFGGGSGLGAADP